MQYRGHYFALKSQFVEAGDSSEDAFERELDVLEMVKPFKWTLMKSIFTPVHAMYILLIKSGIYIYIHLVF